VIDVQISATGSNPTVVSTRAWLEGSTVPSWQLTVQDTSSARITAAGHVGLVAQQGTASANLTLQVPAFQATTTDAAIAGAPATKAAGTSTSAAVPTTSAPAPTTSASRSLDPSPTVTTRTTTAPPPAPTTSAPATSAPTSSTAAPAPTTSTTTTPAPAPSTSTAAGGAPNATNTGVPAGTTLTRVDGNLHIKTSGTYSGLDVYGTVYIEAPDVTVKNSIIRGSSSPSTSQGLVNNYTASATNFVLQDSELVPAVSSMWFDGVQGSNITLRRVNIHGVQDGMKVMGDNVTIQDSWIHGLVLWPDPNKPGQYIHDDGVQVLGGKNIHISGNTIEGGNNSALQVTQTLSAVTNLALTDNVLGGGACTVNLQDLPLTSMSGIAVQDNQFLHTSTYNCPITAYNGVSFTNTGNTWIDAKGTIGVKWRS
jgi:hypothetical protein